MEVQRNSDPNRQGRSVQARIPQDLAKQQDSRDGRSRRARRPADRDLRVGRDDDVPRGEERRQVYAARYAQALRRDSVADVPDGERRPDARSGPSFPPLRARTDRVRGRSLYQRSQAPLRCYRQARRRGGLYGGRIFDRGYGDLPMAAHPSLAGTKARGFSASEALVRGDRSATGGSARPRRDERGSREVARRQARSEIVEYPVR